MLLPLVLIVLGVGEGLPIACDVTHARRRRLLALAIDALGVFAASHFQALWRTGKLHRLVRRSRDVAQRDAAAADEVGRTWQHLHRRHAARERRGKAGILRPYRVLGPDTRGHRIGRLVAVLRRVDAGARVHAEVRVHVDQPGRDPAALRVDRGGVTLWQRRAYLDDLAVANQHVRAVEPAASPVEDRRIADQHRGARLRVIGRRVRFGARLGRQYEKGEGCPAELFPRHLAHPPACSEA